MNAKRRAPFFVASLVAASLALVGCAGDAVDDEADTSAGAQTVPKPAKPVTLENWRDHEDIVAVRREVEAIDKLPLEVDRKEFCKDSFGETARSIGTDDANKVRTLKIEFGTDDVAGSTTYWYDATARLRFVFQTRSDIRGNAVETRVYFNAAGKKIWEVVRSASDPATLKPNLQAAPFTAPSEPLAIDPDAVVNPSKVFGGAPKCG